LIAKDLKDLISSLQAHLNGNVGNTNINTALDPSERIAYAKLLLSGALQDADIAAVSIGKFTTLKAKAQTVPNNTVIVQAGTFVKLNGLGSKVYAGGNSGAFGNTSGVGMDRIDILSIDDAGTLVITAGVEGGAPTAPSYPVDRLPICEVYIRYNASAVAILDASNGIDSYIKVDARAIINYPWLADGAVTRAKLASGGASGAWFANGTTDLSDPGTAFVDMTDMLVPDKFAAGSGSWDTGNRLLITFNGVIELAQGTGSANFPMAEVRLMYNGDGGSFTEKARTCIDLRRWVSGTTFMPSGPVVFPVCLSCLFAPGIWTQVGFKVQWARTNGATAGTPTIRQLGATYNRQLSGIWLNKPTFA
jgi:hypothetical protein